MHRMIISTHSTTAMTMGGRKNAIISPITKPRIPKIIQFLPIRLKNITVPPFNITEVCVLKLFFLINYMQIPSIRLQPNTAVFDIRYQPPYLFLTWFSVIKVVYSSLKEFINSLSSSDLGSSPLIIIIFSAAL